MSSKKESKTAQQAVKAARKSGSKFDYDASGNLPRLIPMQNGDVLFRDPTDGTTRRFVSGTVEEELAAFSDHPLWGQIEEELETLRRRFRMNQFDDGLIPFLTEEAA